MDESTREEQLHADEAAERDRLDAMQRGARDVSRSVSGFDEIAIKAAFGREFEDLGELQTQRALVFLLLRRQPNMTDGTMPATDRDHYQRVQIMTLHEVGNRLAEHGGPAEVFEEEPMSDQGKGDASPLSEPRS